MEGILTANAGLELPIKGQPGKQPYAIAMKDRRPFGLGSIWENWKDPASGEWIRTHAIITTDANELVGEIHDRMPLRQRAYCREIFWLTRPSDRKMPRARA